MATSVMWFRRDLRLHDQAALAAAADAGEVLGRYVIEPALWDAGWTPRTAFLAGCLTEIDAGIGGKLL
ncbi:MAG: Deoxyribodipyrimidine photo-lyase, partial [Acidimicrobiia bacterium]|nr:Deoxyribodipyrimidine photo-lyase [Acidimicrobiia bacterium]